MLWLSNEMSSSDACFHAQLASIAAIFIFSILAFMGAMAVAEKTVQTAMEQQGIDIFSSTHGGERERSVIGGEEHCSHHSIRRLDSTKIVVGYSFYLACIKSFSAGRYQSTTSSCLYVSL